MRAANGDRTQGMKVNCCCNPYFHKRRPSSYHVVVVLVLSFAQKKVTKEKASGCPYRMSRAGGAADRIIIPAFIG